VIQRFLARIFNPISSFIWSDPILSFIERPSQRAKLAGEGPSRMVSYADPSLMKFNTIVGRKVTLGLCDDVAGETESLGNINDGAA
jgi:hypothetical protein